MTHITSTARESTEDDQSPVRSAVFGGNLVPCAPSLSPLWFTVDGDDVVFSTGRDSLKGRHLAANPRAALTVDSDEFPYAYVTVCGPVVLTDDPDELLEWNTKLAERYVPEGRAEEYGRRNSSPDMLVCRLRLQRISAFAEIAS